MSHKAFDPTPRKRKEAIDRGQLPRGMVLTAMTAVLGALCGVAGSATSTTHQLLAWTRVLFLGQDVNASAALQGAGNMLASALVLPCAGAVMGALLASVGQTGFHLKPGWLVPKFERLHPLEGLKRLWTARSLLELGRSLAIAAVVVLIGVFLAREVVSQAVRCGWHDSRCFSLLLPLFSRWGLKLAIAGVGLGCIDAWCVRRRWWNDLKMSREELLREQKQSEGDPHHKAHRKALHGQLSQGGPLRGVQNASAVVVNPTHLAVAIRYEVRECDAPYLVAKARDASAQTLREEARSLGIPVVRDIPLARSLIPLDVGEMIPQELFEAAAVVLRIAAEKQALNVFEEKTS